MVQSNNSELLYPLNFFTANAGIARIGLGLAAHATNPTVQITNGGSGATNAASARTNFGLVWSGLTNASASDFRSALGLPLAALTNTNAADFLSAIGVGAGSSSTFAGITLTNGTNSLGLSATASVTRTNLGLTWTGLTNASASTFRTALELGASWLTNTNAATFRSAIELGATNDVSFNSVAVTNAAQTRVNLGVGAAWLTNTNVTNFRTAIGLGTASDVAFNSVAVTNASQTRANLGLGSTWLTNTNATNFRAAIGLGATNDVTFGKVSVLENDVTLSTTVEDEGASVFVKRGTNSDVFLLNLGFTNNSVQLFVPIGFQNTTNAATTRTNLGLPLSALTNTSNITLMRALSGSTNTNHPFSGSISVTGTNNTNTLVFSNGILQSVQ